MPRNIDVVISVIAVTSLVGTVASPVAGQTHERLRSISANFSTDPTAFRESEARLDEMIRENELRIVAVHADRQFSDREHEAFAQYFGGVPVYGGNVIRQKVNGVTVSIFGTVYEGINVATIPTLGIGEVGFAIEQQSGATLFRDSANLTILPTLDGGYALAYRMLLNDARTYVLDARSGAVLQEIDERRYQSEIGSGTGALGDNKKVSATKILQSGTDTSLFEARDGLRPSEIVTLDTRGSEDRLVQIILGQDRPADTATDADNTWNDTGVVDAHVHVGWTYDYFSQGHAWSGVDGADGRITSTVNAYNVLPNNAFFLRPPFGPDGAGLVAFGETYEGNPMTPVDVVAHELMHGITYSSVNARTGSGLKSNFVLELGPSTVLVDGTHVACAGLELGFSSGASYPFYCLDGQFVLVHNPGGAVNEAFADVFGTAAEFYIQAPGTGFLRADYQIGEDIPEMGVSHGSRGPIRSVSDPGSLYVDSTQSVTYPGHAEGLLRFGVYIDGDTLRVAPIVFFENSYFMLNSTDSAGVHWNATLFGHVFYLAVEGGTNVTSGLTVTGVGSANRHQIEQVFFRAMTELMPNSVTNPLVADVLGQAAFDLFGANSTVVDAIDEALSAVGL